MPDGPTAPLPTMKPRFQCFPNCQSELARQRPSVCAESKAVDGYGNSAKALADLDRAIELDPKVLSGLDRKAATLYVDRARAQIIENKVSSALADLGRALEPIVYIGPAEALPRPNWRLKPPAELLDLKICDPAVGSGDSLSKCAATSRHA